MSYGPHPNDFHFAECMFTYQYGPFTHIPKLTSKRWFLSRRKWMRGVIPWRYYIPKPWSFCPGGTESTAILRVCSSLLPISVVRLPLLLCLTTWQPQKLPNNNLRRLLPYRNRSLYKVHDTQGLAKLRPWSLNQGRRCQKVRVYHPRMDRGVCQRGQRNDSRIGDYGIQPSRPNT